ncbi:MAG TPA: high-affinity nickel-transporter, partial [Chloroflexota bacterium]
MGRRLLALIALLLLATLSRPVVAWAHPLGNFTINRYSRLEVQPALLRIRYVLDEAEIPTYQDMALLHPGGAPTAAEQQQFLAARVERLRAHLHVIVGGQAVAITLEPGTAALSFPPGQGGLPLLRVTAWFRADLPAAAAGATAVGFVDDNYDDRLGWKEIVVRGLNGVAVQQSTVTAIDQSDELRSYPQDMLASPLDVRSAQFSYVASAASEIGASNLLQPRGRSTALLAAATNAFTALVSRQALSLPFILFALLAAIALGGVHALSPGHGKTIVGAYLVGSRGAARHAALLGLTVTITHTAGVFALGCITLLAARFIVPERLYPWLSTLSGLLVAAI